MAFYVEIKHDNEVIERIGPYTEKQAEQLAANISPNKVYTVHVSEDNSEEVGN